MIPNRREMHTYHFVLCQDSINQLGIFIYDVFLKKLTLCEKIGHGFSQVLNLQLLIQFKYSLYDVNFTRNNI
jgi:hypothetical protein